MRRLIAWIILPLVLVAFFFVATCFLTIGSAIERGDLADASLCDDGRIAIFEHRGALPQHIIDETLVAELRQPAMFQQRALQRNWKLIRLWYGLKWRYTPNERRRMFDEMRPGMRLCPGTRERLLRRGIALP